MLVGAETSSGSQLSYIVPFQGENIMHSSGTVRSDANVHAGLAFSVVSAHTGALDRAGAGADVGRLKILLME